MRHIYILLTITIPFLLFGCIAVTPQAQDEATPVVETVTPRNGYTGIQDVDTLINALLEQDVGTIVSHVQFIELPCTHQSGLGGPPKCGEGQEEGTVVEVFPIMGTSGSYLTRETIHALKPNVTKLYAVYEVAEDMELIDTDWPTGQYGLVFCNADPVPSVITVFITDDNIVRVDNNFVQSPEQALPASVNRILYKQVLSAEKAGEVQQIREEPTRLAEQRAIAIENLRSFLNDAEIEGVIEYQSTVPSPYDGTNVEYYVIGKNDALVSIWNDRVLQFGPKSLPWGEEGIQYDVTPRYSPEELEAMARAFIQKRAPELDLDTLTSDHGSKEGTHYFFQWKKSSQERIQVGFAVGGDLLSYLDLLTTRAMC